MSLGTYKVVLLGEGRVGKTSIASRFVDDKFDSGQISTVQANMYSKKRIPIEGTLDAGKGGSQSKGRKYVDIALWDTAGQERYHALGPIYYRNANGAVLVYDITDADTFERIRMWIKELRQVVGENIHIVICGNKSDLEKEREVNLVMAEKFAKSQGAAHFSTSAKTNEGVAEAFQCLVQKILVSAGLVGEKDGDGEAEEGGEDETVPPPRGTKGKSASKRGGVKIDLDGDEPEPEPAQSEEPEPTPTPKGKKKGAAKIADDESSSAPPAASSGYGYDDYGSYGSGTGAGASDDATNGGTKGATSSTNGTSNKAAPPKRKDTPTTESTTASTSKTSKDNDANSKKNQPITLSDDKKGNAKGKKDKKDKDCC